MDDIKIQFDGFSPPSFVHSYFIDLLEQIREEAPTWASIRANVHRVGEEFRGMIRITSPAGEFFSTASSKRVSDLGRKLTQRIRRQLNNWKSTRFSHESTRKLDLQENSEEESHNEVSSNQCKANLKKEVANGSGNQIERQ